MTYSLLILTPDGKIFDGDAEFVSAPGKEGSFGVLARHAPIISELSPGVLKVKTPEQEKFFAISSGVLEVAVQGNVLILIEQAVLGASLEDAQNKFKQMNPVSIGV